MLANSGREKYCFMLRNIFFHKNTVGENSTSRFLKEKRRSAKSDVSKVLFPDIGKITNLASLDDKAWWQGMEMLEIFACLTLAAVHFADQNWIPKTVCCVRCVMVCKNGFTKQKLHFWLYPWSLLTILNFSERGPTDAMVF